MTSDSSDESNRHRVQKRSSQKNKKPDFGSGLARHNNEDRGTESDSDDDESEDKYKSN